MTDRNAEIVKQSVTVEQAVRFYLPGESIVRGRIRCPIHGGVDRNCSIRDRYYKCFVCGAGGSVISLVMSLFGLTSAYDAICKLNNDFMLGLPISGTESFAEAKRAYQKQAAYAERRKEEERLHEEYLRALERFHSDIAAMDTGDVFSDDYVYAVKNVDSDEYAMLEAERRWKENRG